MGRSRQNPPPPATAFLAIVILALYAFELTGNGLALCERFGFIPVRPSLATAVSSLFIHDPASWLHVGGNVAFLLLFGAVVEREIGALRFLGLFFAAGLGGAAMHLVVEPSATEPLVGASGSVFGVLAMAGVLRPRLLGFAAGFGVVEVGRAFSGDAGAVSFGAHIGGLAAGTVFAALARLHVSVVAEQA